MYALGLLFLLGGAELMVRGAVGLAEKLGVSKMVIGMTVAFWYIGARTSDCAQCGLIWFLRTGSW